MGKVVSYIGTINEMDFQKDVLLTPCYLAKWLNTTCDFYYGMTRSSNAMPDTFRNVHLHCLNASPSSILFFIRLLCRIVKDIKNIDVLTTFHFSYRVVFLTLLLKLIRPKVKVWVLGDLNLDIAEKLSSSEFVFSKGIKGFVQRRIVNSFFKKLNIFSLETTRYIELFKPVFEKNEWRGLTYFPCSWDEDNPNSTKICTGKENIILSCARFGTYQKNTEMLLEGLAKTDMKNWKVYLVGPVTSDFSMEENASFNDYIKHFFNKYPLLKDKIIFTGAIFDTQKLFSYFQRAKLFVMTSRYEGFANVFAQARWNQCLIVSTDVGGAQDMSDNWKYGAPVKQNDSDSLCAELQKIIAKDITLPPRAFADTISYNYTIPTFIINKLKN